LIALFTASYNIVKLQLTKILMFDFKIYYAPILKFVNLISYLDFRSKNQKSDPLATVYHKIYTYLFLALYLI